MVIYQTLNCENDNLSFEVLCLAFANFHRLTAMKNRVKTGLGFVHVVSRPSRPRPGERCSVNQSFFIVVLDGQTKIFDEIKS